jgi:endonuclease/exonuclease/phosphatase (EEP) superfamily protein YafD
MTASLSSAVTRKSRFPKFGRLIKRLLWIAILGANVALLLAYLLPQNLRETRASYLLLAFVAFMVRSLQFQVALGLFVAAIVAWIARSRILALMGLLPAIVLLAPVAMEYAPKQHAKPSGQTCRVMSMNLLYKNENTAAIIKQIRAADPDVLLVEEFTLFQNDALQKEIGADYPYQSIAADHGSSGIGIFSRIPMSEAKDIGLFNSRQQLRATLHLADGDVALYAVHLKSPQSVKSVTAGRIQTADLVDRLKREKLPILIGGDFNFTEDSPNAAALRDIGLVSTHDLAGHGRGVTWPYRGRWPYIPGIRIDHVMISHQLTCSRSYVAGNSGSDHRPIVADVGWAALR